MERKNLAQMVLAFSKKLNKIDDKENLSRVSSFSENRIIQDEINRRENERFELLRKKYLDYLEPRTPDIEDDEAVLLNAYDFFCKLNETCNYVKESGSKISLRSMEIVCSLCNKGDYTTGEQMSFLRLWFLKKMPESLFVPELILADNKQYYLNFTARELWSPSSFEKEILQSLEGLPENS